MKVSFEHNKISRTIKTHGQELEFKRKDKNAFNEEIDSYSKTILIKGVYHEQSSYVSVSENNATRSQSKPIPMFLTLYDEFEKEPVLLDDVVTRNGKNYRVTGSTNVQGANFGVDISLELIL